MKIEKKKANEGETTNQFFLFLKICFELKKKITTKLGWVWGGVNGWTPQKLFFPI